MDLSNIGKVEDRISGLPDSILHHILSNLDIKPVAQTAVLSKRWKYLWTSIPALVFPYWCHYSLSETNTFMEFVETTLLLHDTSSSIQKFHLQTNEHMSASRVHSWIKNLTMGNLEELDLWLDQDKAFFVPLSLFTCESLIKLEITANDATHIPRSFCFPKLKILTLRGTRFTTEDCWNELHFSNCPVLERLTLEDCTWFGMRNFCISTPALKFLKISTWEAEGLQDCALKIDAPNLVSLAYFGRVAKEYVLSSFQTLESAEILFCTHEISIEQNIGNVAAASKFIRSLLHVRCLQMYAETLEALSIVNDFVNILPVFRVLKDLVLKEGKTTDKSLFQLFKAVPNLRWLVFEESCVDDNKNEEHSWAGHMLTAGPMFKQLRSVTFVRSIGNSRQMRWVKLILTNAKALKTVILCVRSDDAVNKEVFLSELRSLPRTSDGCEFELEEY